MGYKEIPQGAERLMPRPASVPARSAQPLLAALRAARRCWPPAPRTVRVKGVAEVAGFATTPQESKPFVQETRPADAGLCAGRTSSASSARRSA